MGLLYTNDEPPADGIGTHVLIIGVSSYGHFPGGPGAGVIHSAENGAKAFSKWLIREFYNPEKPLMTVRGLFSSREFSLGGDEQVVATSAPTWPAFKQIYADWIAESTRAPGSRLIFYFAGHGVGSDLFHSLLLEDFNSDADSAMDGAIDFNNLKSALTHTSKASDIWFFIDACRDASLLERAAGSWGRMVHANAIPFFTTGVQVTDFRSTTVGGFAAGIPGELSVFSTALISALSNNAYDNQDDQWRSVPLILSAALNTQLEALYGQLGWPIEDRQDPDFNCNGQAVFTMKRPGQLPNMQISLTCEKAADNMSHDLYWSVFEDNAELERREVRDLSRWNLNLAAKKYYVGALDDNGDHRGRKDISLDRPFSSITLRV